MFARGLFLLASTAAASEMTVDGQRFTRVEEELTWYEARDYCRVYHTDLANLQSLNGLSSIISLYSILKGNPAWIGLFFDVETGTLSWSSGPIFTTPFWITSLSDFTDGFCALLEVIMKITPNVKAARCLTRNTFICYYDPAIGHLITTDSPLRVPTTPVKTGVQIGHQNFIRITGEEKTWSAALQYCQKHYTSLANLQSVTEGTSLKLITNDIPSWIGLYFDENTQSLKWSNNFDSSIPTWLLVPMFEENQCATLRRYENFKPRVFPASCTDLKPFICYYDPHRTTLSPLPGQGNSPARAEETLASQPTLPGNNSTSDCTATTGQELSTGTGQSEPKRSPSGLKTITTQASSSGTGSMAPGRPAPHLPITSRPTTRLGPTESQTEPESGSSSVTRKKVGGTSQGLLASSAPPGRPLSPGSEQRFGILKADFNSPAILESEATREEFLREIQEAVKIILGHERFRLKWIGFEENQN